LFDSHLFFDAIFLTGYHYSILRSTWEWSDIEEEKTHSTIFSDHIKSVNRRLLSVQFIVGLLEACCVTSGRRKTNHSWDRQNQSRCWQNKPIIIVEKN